MTTRKKSTAAEMKAEIKANASKVWLAGLGALATAEEEGGKLFRGLVKKGETYEKKGKAQLDALKEKVETLAGAARELRDAPVGHFVDVITNGFGAMPDYASQIRAEDSWAISAYIRALQLSGHATLADVPPAQRGALQ